MSAIIVECPNRPPMSMYEALGLVRPHSTYSPKKPDHDAGARTWARYHEDVGREAELHALQKGLIVPTCDAPMFWCGSIKPEPFCRCGHTAEMLCDHPMGRGKTCDLPLCYCCRKHVGDDLDLCEIHFAEFVKRTGAKQINPWPPKRKP